MVRRRTSTTIFLRPALRCCALATISVIAFTAVVFNAASTVFGPRTYQRGSGEPVAVTSTFRVTNPSNPYTLRLVNHGVTSAVVSVNGQVVLQPADFGVKEEDKKDGDFVPLLARSVTLRAGDNVIAVELRGKPGTSLAAEIVGTVVDTTPPTITAAVGPPPNAAGWNKADVTVTFTCTDEASGVATCPAPVVVSTDGANQIVSGTAVDKAGNSATTSVTVNLDKTPPVVTASQSPAPAASGWNTGPVVVTFAATDALSGVAAGTLTAPITLATDGANLSASGQASDVAGNTRSFTHSPVNIDQTAPAIIVALSPTPNANGWNNGPVTAHFTCTDGGSGIATCPPDQVMAADGAGQTVSGTTTDNAGHTASITSAAFSIDQTKPTVTVALSPSPNDKGWYGGPVTAHFTCGDSGSGIAACPGDQVIATAGIQTIAGTASDKAGNTASVTSSPIKIDLGPPTIAATVSPAPNAAGWNNTPVTVHFICADSGAGIAFCPPNQVAANDGVAQSFAGTAMDQAGNTATALATINIDRTPPVLTFTSPVNGTTLFTPTVMATGSVTDTLSGVTSVTCGGVQAAVSGSSVSCGLTLGSGPNSIDAIATDAAGNTASVTLGLVYTRVPVIKIASPDNSSYLNITPTTVSGTVDDPTAQVTINSIPAPTANGSFSIALPLAEGPNVITASAASDLGAVGTASIEVTLDTTPPHVTITSPPDQFLTTDGSISVSGSVNDIVVGTVNQEQAQVTVNGASAQVSNRSFVAANVPLDIGPNIIQVVGRDRVGNAATTQITVTRRALTAPQIKLISGNNQAGAIGATLAQPLIVSVTDATGNPLSNKPVVFKVTQNDGIVAAGGAPGPTVIATTDADGRARAQWTLGSRAGAGGNSVEAYSVGFESIALFTATGTQGVAGKIVVDAGNDQIGAIGQQLPKPFIAVVVDTGNNRLGGVPVTFSVLQGGGGFGDAHETSVMVDTDSDGRAAATLTLGLQEGNANNFVQATFPTNPSFAASFTASGRAPGNVVSTTISGVVLDNSNVPVPGVTVRAVLTSVLHSNANSVQTATAAQTDAQGQFSITQAPVGLVKLLVDGATAQLPGTYPSLEYDLVTIAGQINTVGQPMYLLPLNADNQLCVTATTGGGTLTIPEAPGFSLTFGPGQVTFPGGAKTGCVSVTVVHGDKVPMVPGFGQQPRFIVTIQPAGAVFNPPAPITLPNVDGLRPRQVTEMYSFDHDIGSFVAIGTGIVSDDGQIIRSSAGVGVLKAGWHCGGDPAATGSAADCGACQTCTTDHCEADPSQNGQTLPDDKCKVCKDGTPTPIDLAKTGVELEYKFGPPTPTVDKVNAALEELKSIGVIAEVHLLQITGKLETKQCCEAESGKGPGNEITGSVTGDFGSFKLKGKIWPLGPIPSFKITIDIFGIASIEAKGEFIGGVFVGGEAKVTGQLGYRKKECSKDPADQAGCVFGKLEIGVEPSISAEIGGEASITYDCILFCDKTTIAAAASFVAGNLSWPISIAGVQYNNESCSAGLTGGFLNFGDGKFKVSVSFSGSVKTDSAGLKEFKETFTFVDCTINRSGVSCTFGF